MDFVHRYATPFIKNKIIVIFQVTMFCILCAFSHQSTAAFNHEQSNHWNTLTSKHFELHYYDEEEKLAIKAINIAEKKLLELQDIFNWIPEEPIEIILSDEIDVANGFVIPFLPKSRMTLYITAPNPFFDFDDWLELLITHELSHSLHLDKASGAPLTLRKGLGNFPLLYPNAFQPFWLIEGLATYMETDFNKGIGRGQSSMYGMLMRLEVENGLKSLNQVNIFNLASWPMGTTKYLYGYYFFEFLENNYSKASINRFIESYSDNLIPYRVGTSTILTFGKDLDELWDAYLEYLKNKFRQQIDELEDTDLVIGENISNNGYFKMFVQPIGDNNLLYAENNGLSKPALYLKKTALGKTEKITDLFNDSQLDYHPGAGIIISQLEIYRNANYYYDLFHISLEDKKLERLTRGDRYRLAAWNPQGDQFVALYNRLGKHTLVLLSADGKLLDLLWEGKSNEYISHIDWSPDGKRIVASIKRENTSWDIEEFTISSRLWNKITSDNATETQPKYSHDGSEIYFSADYNGIYNIQKYSIRTRTIHSITQVFGGAFSPTFDENQNLYYIGYTANGYDIFRVSDEELASVYITTIPSDIEKEDNLLEDSISETSEKDITVTQVQLEDSVTYEKSEYSSLSHIAPTWWMPFFDLSHDSYTVGAFTSGSDALKIHSYDGYLAFDFKATAISGLINYSYDRWFPLFQTHLGSINQNNYKTDIAQFELLAPLLTRNHRWFAGSSFLFERNQDIIKNAADEDVKIKTKDPLVGFGIIYDSLRRNIISNSIDDGRQISLVAETSDLFGGDHIGKMLIGKWREFFLIRPQHVIAVRAVGGFALQQPRPFQLGGSIGDSDLSSGSILSDASFGTTLYNKRRYALRGYPSDAPSLRGRRMLMYSVEWRFPLSYVERSFDTFPLGLQQFSGSVFVDSGGAWDVGTTPKNYHYGLGFEIHAHTEVFFAMPLRLRMGYAYGLDEDGGHYPYIKFGSSF